MHHCLRFITALVLGISVASAAQPGEVAVLPPVLYLPVEQVTSIDPKGRAVMVPYEQFITLWDKLNAVPVKPDDTQPDAALMAWSGHGRITDAGIEADLTLHLLATKPGWSEVQIGNFGALDFKAPEGVVINQAHNMVTIHMPKPGAYRLSCTAIAAAVERDGVRKAALVVPPIDGVVSLNMSDAATQVTPPSGVLVQHSISATSAQVRLAGLRGEQIISWTRPVAAVRVEPLLIAQVDAAAVIGERNLRIEARAMIDVLRQEQDKLSVAVPPGMQVISVQADGLKSWDRVGNNLEMTFHRPVSGRVLAALTLEKDLAAGTSAVALVMPAVVGAARQGGHLALIAGDGISLTAQPGEGWTRIDPSVVGRGDVVAAFRAMASPQPLPVTLATLAPELRAVLHQLVRLDGEEDRLQVWADMDVRKAGLFAFTLLVPEEWELADAPGGVVDDVRIGVAVNGVRPVELVLRARALGQTRMAIQFRRPATLPRDQQPRSTKLSVVRVQGARTQRGLLGVALPPSWQATVSAREGLTAPEAARIAQAPWNASGRIDESLAFSWIDGATAAVLALDVSPRAREVSLRQQELIEIDEAAMRRSVEWIGEVRHRPLAALRVVVPSAWDSRLTFIGVAESKVESRADGLSTWELRMASPVLGALRVSAQWSEAMPNLISGVAATIAVPAWKVQDVSSLSTVTAVARIGSLDVSAIIPDADSIATADLPAGLRRNGLVAGFQSATPRAGMLTITRHDVLRLAQAGIGRIQQTVVVAADGQVRIRSVFQVVSNGLPHIEVSLPERTTVLEATVDSRPARISKRSERSIVLPIGAPGRHTIAVVFQQTLPEQVRGRHAAQVSIPGFASAQVPVEGQHIQLSLPAELAVTGWDADSRPLAQREGVWSDLLRRRVPQGPREGFAPQPDSENHGLTVPVTLQGQVFHLVRLGDGGNVGWSAAPREWFDLAGLALAALSIVAVWRWRRRSDRLAAVGLIAGVVWVGVSGPWLALGLGLLLGAGGGLLALGTWRVLSRMRAWWAGRKAGAAKRSDEPTTTPDPMIGDRA